MCTPLPPPPTPSHILIDWLARYTHWLFKAIQPLYTHCLSRAVRGGRAGTALAVSLFSLANCIRVLLLKESWEYTSL